MSAFARLLEVGGSGGGGKGGGGSTYRAPTEAPNSLRSRSVVRVVFILSEGKVNGIKNGAQGIKFDGTPLQAADGSYNFTGVTWQFRDGSSTQTPFEGISDIEAERDVSTKVTVASPVVRTISNVDVTSCRVSLRVPSLVYQDPNTGDLRDSQIDCIIAVKPTSTGVWQDIKTVSIVGKCISPYVEDHRFTLPGTGPWDIRVTRVTADSNQSNLQNDLYFSSFTEISDYKIMYSDSAAVALTFDAQLFGGRIPKITFDLEGILCQVPVNYDPDAGTFSGIWDGTFKLAYTTDPAWIFRDLCLSNRYGLGRFLAAGGPDKWELYAISQYNNELVPNGRGGYERRYVFHGEIKSQADAYVVLQAVASAWRGSFYWGNGVVNPVQDRPKDPIALVTPANTLMGSLDYGESSLKSRPTVVRASFPDGDNDFRAAVEVYQDPVRVAKYGYRDTNIVAPGAKERSYAYRHAYWVCETNWVEPHSLVYRPSWDHAYVRPGDVVSVMDPKYSGVDAGGRIVSATTTSAVLDRFVTISSLATYAVVLTMPSGDLVTRQLTNAAGSTDTLTWTTATPDTAQVDSVWVLSSSSLEPRPFRVLRVSEPERHIFEVTASNLDVTKFARIEDGLNLPAPIYSAIPTGALPQPKSINYREYMVEDNGAAVPSIVISWEVTPDPRVIAFEAEYKIEGGAWHVFHHDLEVTATLAPIIPANYSFRVRAMDGLGRSSLWLEIGPLALVGDSALPQDVSGFTSTIVSGQLHMRWGLAQDVDVRIGGRMRIRWSPLVSGVDWGQMVDLFPPDADNVRGGIAGSATEASVQARSGTYAIKAVDQGGRESLNAAYIVTTLPDLDGMNVVDTWNHSPTFTGTHSGTAAPSGTLMLDGTTLFDTWASIDAIVSWDSEGGVVSEGTWIASGYRDLGDVYDCRVWIDLVVTTFAVLDLWDSRAGTMDEWDTIDQTAPSGTCNAVVEIITTQDDPSGAPTWSDWVPVIIGNFVMRAYRLRVRFSTIDTNYNIGVTSLTSYVDVPDRIEKAQGVAVSPSGLTVVYDHGFWTLPALGFQLIGGLSGHHLDIVSQSVGGFTVRILDATETPVSGTVNWTAAGYGRRS